MISTAKEQVSELYNRPCNFSHYRIDQPSSHQVELAYHGIEVLHTVGIIQMSIMLLNDGTFGAFWYRNNVYASVDFDDVDSCSWGISINTVVSGTWNYQDTIPNLLYKAIKTIERCGDIM